jgi:hypothetical protein
MTDLVPWRPIYLDFREFTRTGGTLDLTTITGLEIGVARCDNCEVFDNPAIGTASEHQGTLFLDEFAVVDLKPGAAHRVVQPAFETVSPLPAVVANAAAALLARVTAPGAGVSLVPAWFPEANPNFNTYAQAEALLVFAYEYERTGNIAFRDAARALTARLLSLQIPVGRTQAGAWYTAYFADGATLRPPDRALPKPPPATPCDGNEAMVADPEEGGTLSAKNIDACEWVGNTGWALIALGKVKRLGLYTDSAALQAAIDRGAAWVIRQPAERGHPSYPGLISLGVEGNISAYFGLRAAGKFAEAATLGQAIFEFAWDPVQRRLKPGVRPEDAATAIDVSGSWGALWLRSIGRTAEALASQGYSASVLRTRSYDGAVLGYGDIAGPYTPAVEFAAQAASAGIKDANFVMQQLAPLQFPAGHAYAGAFPGAPNHWYGGPLSPWVTTMAGVSPTAWMYFALCCEPLMPLVAFTDDSLLPAGTPIRAAHVLELRARIDALRARFGLSSYAWTGAVQPGVVVRAQHVNELRTAVEDVYEAAPLAPAAPVWTDATLLAGHTVVRAVHFAEIRNAVIALE